MPHDMLKLDLDFIALDTWDGEAATLTVDGIEVWSWTGRTEGTNECGRGSPDMVIRISEEVEHTAETATLRITTTLDQGPGDESFGIDNVRIIGVQTSFECVSDAVLCQEGEFDSFADGVEEWMSRNVG